MEYSILSAHSSPRPTSHAPTPPASLHTHKTGGLRVKQRFVRHTWGGGAWRGRGTRGGVGAGSTHGRWAIPRDGWEKGQHGEKRMMGDKKILPPQCFHGYCHGKDPKKTRTGKSAEVLFTEIVRHLVAAQRGQWVYGAPIQLAEYPRGGWGGWRPDSSSANS